MKQIILFIIAALIFSNTTAQISIKGIVTDEISPLPSANIYLKNSTKGTTSDEQGNFILNAKKGDTIVVSYTGYLTKEIIIDHQESLYITLDNESLEEVVVIAQGVKTCTRTIYCYSSIITTTKEREFLPKTNTLPSLFPNPSSGGIFNLKMPTLYKEVQVIVSNLLGQQVLTKTYQNANANIIIDLTSVNTGIYLINILADGERLPTQKAIRK